MACSGKTLIRLLTPATRNIHARIYCVTVGIVEQIAATINIVMGVIQPVSIRGWSRKSLSYPCLLDTEFKFLPLRGKRVNQDMEVYDNQNDSIHHGGVQNFYLVLDTVEPPKSISLITHTAP